MSVGRRWPRSVGMLDMVLAGLALVLFAVRVRADALYFERKLGVPFFDWQFYSQAVERWLAGDRIYPDGRISTLVTPAGGSYSYPPASVPLMLPFASYPIGALLWEALLVVALLSGIWVVVSLGWPTRRVRAFALAVVALALFPPAREGIAVGNINIATAGALAWMWAGSPVARAAPAVLAVMKVFPFALSVPQGRHVVLVTVGAVVTVCLVTVPFVGLGAWGDYINGLRVSVPLCDDPDRINRSLACGLQPMVGQDIAKWAGLVLAAALLPISYAAGRGVIGAAAVVGMIMLPATELHGHYWTLLFVLALIVCAEIAKRRAARKRAS